jgi:hypothetical protein
VIVAEPKVLAGASGERGLVPCRRANVKIGATKLALASAKLTLTVKVFAHEFPSIGGEFVR